MDIESSAVQVEFPNELVLVGSVTSFLLLFAQRFFPQGEERDVKREFRISTVFAKIFHWIKHVF